MSNCAFINGKWVLVNRPSSKLTDAQKQQRMVAAERRRSLPTMFAELPPCAGRFAEAPGGQLRSSVRDIEIPACCGARGTALVEVADCSILGRVCTVRGLAINGERTAACVDCKYHQVSESSNPS